MNTKNHKATFFYVDENPYLKLEMDEEKLDGTIYHYEIHKIGLSKFDIEKERDYCGNNYILKLNIYPDSNLKIITHTDITPYKEMTIAEIEKELGYKIKIKN